MPTYEYRCNACGHEFEAFQKITEDPIKTCPKCKKRKVERLLSASAFSLKGGGWYADGYASSGGDKKKKSSGSASVAKDGSSGKVESSKKKAD